MNKRGGQNKLDKRTFQQRSVFRHGDKYDYTNSVYENSYTKVEIKCHIHGIFSQTPKAHMNGAGCPYCYQPSRLTSDIPDDFREIFNALDSVVKLAAHYGVSEKIIRKWMKYSSLSISKRTFDVNGFIEANRNGISVDTYAKDMNYPLSSFRNHLKKLNIDVVNPRSTKKFTFDELHHLHITKELPMTKIGEIHGMSDVNVAMQCKELGIDTVKYINSSNSTSSEELEILDFVRSLYPDARKFYHSGVEIDIGCKSHGLGIEYCGVYWHTERFRDKDFHYKKYQIMKNSGQQLLTIYSDEWKSKKEIVKSIIANKLNKNNHKIYARKCSVVELKSSHANDFCDLNHIQGRTSRNVLNLGLIFDNKLVAVMVFGKHPRNDTLTLARYCTLLYHNVVGGASKLFKHFVQNTEYKEVLSWSDNRWSNGNLYKILGFDNDGELPPSYEYHNGKTNPESRIPKIQATKKKIGCPPEMKEHEYMASKGHYRIWDCGKIRWKWTK